MWILSKMIFPKWEFLDKLKIFVPVWGRTLSRRIYQEVTIILYPSEKQFCVTFGVFAKCHVRIPDLDIVHKMLKNLVLCQTGRFLRLC